MRKGINVSVNYIVLLVVGIFVAAAIMAILNRSSSELLSFAKPSLTLDTGFLGG